MADFPDWLEPMAATLTEERFVAPGWVFERKVDGIRMLAFKRGEDVRLLSRNRLPQSHAYPGIHAAIAALPIDNLVLDGEATGVWGQPGEPMYHVFDLPWLDDRDLTGLPLSERRVLLEGMPLASPILLIDRVPGDAPWEHACREGWEGVIAKQVDSVYEHRRSRAWLKMKCELSQELVVGGFTEPKGSRVGLGALLVGYFEGEKLCYAGRVGTGFTAKLLLDLREQFRPLEIPETPFANAEDLPPGARWVRPEVVVQVSFMEWTHHAKMRHPRLIAVRTDKRAADVARESP